MACVAGPPTRTGVRGDEGVPERLGTQAVDTFGDELSSCVQDPPGHTPTIRPTADVP